MRAQDLLGSVRIACLLAVVATNAHRAGRHRSGLVLPVRGALQGRLNREQPPASRRINFEA